MQSHSCTGVSITFILLLKYIYYYRLTSEQMTHSMGDGLRGPWTFVTREAAYAFPTFMVSI